MINIGPWWLYDTILLSTLLAIIVFGIRSGFFSMLYLLIWELLIIILCIFIPPLIAYAINSFFISLLSGTGIYNLFGFANGLFNSIFSLFSNVLNGIVLPPFDFSNMVEELFKNSLSLFITFSIEIIMYIVLNVIMIITFFILRKKLSNARMNKSANMLLGGSMGIVFGLSTISVPSFILSFPFLELNTQRVAIVQGSNLDGIEDIIMNRTKYGNKYVQKAITGKVAKTIPPIAFEYTVACIDKYVAPMVQYSISNPDIWTSGDVSQKIFNIFGIFEDSIIKGYENQSVIGLSIPACIERLPKDSRTTVRLVVETILTVSGVQRASIFGTQMPASAEVLFAQMDLYKEKVNNNKKMGINEFVDFYNSLETNENQFLIASNFLESQRKNNEITKVLRDPQLLYNFMKNVYEVNMYKTLGTMFEIGPSIFSTFTFMRGFELVPSGMMQYILGSVEDDLQVPSPIKLNKRAVSKPPFNFELRKYMEYVHEEGLQ